jgi:hypothetical protein
MRSIVKVASVSLLCAETAQGIAVIKKNKTVVILVISQLLLLYSCQF